MTAQPRREARRATPGNRLINWWPFLLLALIILGLHFQMNITAVASPPSDRWSRHVTLGTTHLNVPPGADSAPDGSLICAWPYEDDIFCTRVSPAAELTPLPLELPRAPRRHVKTAAGETIHLFWIGLDSRPSLYWATVDPLGKTVRPPAVVCTGVRDYALVRPPGPTTTREALGWIVAVTEEGLLPFRLRPDRGLHPSTPLRVAGAKTVSGQAGPDGLCHLLYLARPGDAPPALYHVALNDDLQWGLPRPVTTPAVSPREVLRTPRLGLAGRDAFALYSVEHVRPPSGEAKAHFVSFDPGSGTAAGRRRLDTNTLLFGGTSPFVMEPTPRPGHEGPLEVALDTLVARSRSRRYQEICVGVLDRQGLDDLQQATRTREACCKPQLIPDGRGGRYLCWIQTSGFNRYDIGVAATTDSFKQTVNARTREDWGRAAADTLGNGFFALAFLVIASYWLVPAYLLVGLAYFFSLGQVERRPYTMAVAAIVVHLAMQYVGVTNTFYQETITVIMPGWLASVWGRCLVLLGLAAVSLLAGLPAWRIRRASQSPMALYTAFTIPDTILVLLLYGPFAAM